MAQFSSAEHALIDPLAAVRFYAAGLPFRSAEGSELVLDSPFRRPVRCEDLRFIDYTCPLTAEDMLQLSGLASHRMLLNIYEGEYFFLTDHQDRRRTDEAAAFYSDRSRVLGEMARPFLERHVFSFLEPSAGEFESATSSEAVLALERTGDACLASAQQVFEAIRGAGDQRRAATFLVIQLTGPGLSRGLAAPRLTLSLDVSGPSEGAGLLDEMLSAAAAPSAWARGWRRLAESCGLVGRPHAYWQFYLTSSLALANYLHFVARHRAYFYQAVGAFWLDRLRGEGVSQFGRLLTIADADFLAQIAWADRPVAAASLARRLVDAIRRTGTPVDLETYVESRDERSTTHVHDTDRLLVIERGEMDFWSTWGAPLRLVAGDACFVPRHRLHGSVVVTPVCVYHQPIITSTLWDRLGLRPEGLAGQPSAEVV